MSSHSFSVQPKAHHLSLGLLVNPCDPSVGDLQWVIAKALCTNVLSRTGLSFGFTLVPLDVEVKATASLLAPRVLLRCGWGGA